ncbi:hypothetical protein BU25DRAFT_421142 [Macroventuria anomochaeta]|uniref:Uncharacterized protein n=1 Tax=Macroventuria anomochaeta TaxID=301207 RepID=A0ACB6S288_9PLEO|nr:uncharacterized protein BU25DRAFT_421142 [Macroventuria anomochaeta]KAF2628144.1 hypothetical protein BU25DRAFT_421142 [Macroventuria anomochaeta]
MSSDDPFTTTSLALQLAHAQRVNELHRSTLEALPNLPVYMKKVLWGTLNEQDAWPPHLAGYVENSQEQNSVWSEDEEWSLLTIRRIMGPTLSLQVIGAHFLPHHGGEGTKAHWEEMMRRDVGWDPSEDMRLLQLVRRSDGYDVQTVANTSLFGRDRKIKFGRVALGIAYQRALREM